METIRSVSDDKRSLHCASLNYDSEENQFVFLSCLIIQKKRKSMIFVYDKNNQCMRQAVCTETDFLVALVHRVLLF